MGNRLSKIYTRTGDDGSTGLGDGARVPKESLRVEAYGTVDELNSTIGLILSTPIAEQDISTSLMRIQHELFDLGGELCIPGTIVIKADQVSNLEDDLDRLNANLTPLKNFVLPGGTSSASFCHLARTVCRRAERSAWALARVETTNDNTLKYLNRLSDYLFVVARALNHRAGHAEPLWQQDRS